MKGIGTKGGERGLMGGRTLYLNSHGIAIDEFSLTVQINRKKTASLTLNFS